MLKVAVLLENQEKGGRGNVISKESDRDKEWRELGDSWISGVVVL